MQTQVSSTYRTIQDLLLNSAELNVEDELQLKFSSYEIYYIYFEENWIDSENVPEEELTTDSDDYYISCTITASDDCYLHILVTGGTVAEALEAAIDDLELYLEEN